MRRLAQGLHPTPSAHHKQLGQAQGELLRKAAAAAATPGDGVVLPRGVAGQGSREQRPAEARPSSAPPSAAQNRMAALRARVVAKQAAAKAQVEG